MIKRAPVQVAPAPVAPRAVSASAVGSSALAPTALVDALSMPDAEIELCGWLLSAPAETLPLGQRLMDFLDDSMFSHPIYRAIWKTARTLVAANQVAGASAVLDAATRLSLDVGGIEHLAQLIEDPLVARADEPRLWQSAKIVRDYAMRRRADAIMRKRLAALSSDVPLERQLSELTDDIQALSFQIETQQSTGPEHISVSMGNVIDAIYNKEIEARTIVPTCYRDLDLKLGGGVKNQDLVLLAGRPSMGKTALAMGIGRNMAMNAIARRRVLFFSGEMIAEQLAMRALSAESGMPAAYLREANEEDPQLHAALNDVLPRFSEFDPAAGGEGIWLWVDDTPGMTLPYISAESRKFCQTFGHDIVIMVDYLQLVANNGGAGGPNVNTSKEVGSVSTKLKLLARQLNCPVIALAQLNRSLEARANKRPIMSDLRESGNLEQDADTILFVYRDSVYNTDADPGLAEVIIGKQRGGELGTVYMGFEGALTRFSNYNGAQPADAA